MSSTVPSATFLLWTKKNIVRRQKTQIKEHSQHEAKRHVSKSGGRTLENPSERVAIADDASRREPTCRRELCRVSLAIFPSHYRVMLRN